MNPAIYDVLYYSRGAEKPNWKSLLVETAPGRFREIYHDQKNEGDIFPSFLVQAGGETLLGLDDDHYKQDVTEEYFWFGPDGPVRIDFNPIWKAAQAAIPTDQSVWPYQPNGRTSFPQLTFLVRLRSPVKGNCCGTGVVTVKIRLDSGLIVVTGVQFDPNAEARW